MTHFTHARMLGGLLLGLALAAGAFPATAAAKLTLQDRSLLAAARAEQRAEVTVLIATADGASRPVATGLAALGGRVRYQDDELGYIRAVVPTAQVEAAARLPGIEAFNLDETFPLRDPRPEPEADVLEVDPPDDQTPAQNPYLPTQDVGAPQFVAAHPSWDGRGVTIAIVDSGVTLDHPALRTTTMGEPKVVDWVTATDPVDDNDPTWIAMQDQVSGHRFVYRGVQYQAPANGSYRIGLFNERDPRLSGANSEYAVPTVVGGVTNLVGDINRDRNPEGSSGLFAVLWDTTRNLVWVDANQDQDFSDEPALTDYRLKRDVGTFGRDNPATPVSEEVKFVVQTRSIPVDGRLKYVNIGIVSGAHGSHVAGIAAGQGLFGGAMNGCAPGARLISVRVCLFIEGCTSHGLIEGMIYAVKQANADVVNMSIGGLPALNDGNNTRAVLYNRLIERYKAQMFFSAGNNGPGLNTVGDPGVATRVIASSAYLSKETWLACYGNIADKEDNLIPFSARGPREDGGFKPNVVAPGAAVSTVPMWQAGQPVPGTYPLPPGYAMFNGTSMSSPQSCGAAALLVSAARQTGAQWKPAQLRKALLSSARFLPVYGAHEQGNGLLQVGAAWELLKQNLKTDEIESLAPVRTIISQFLAIPNYGPGLYEREGWAAGQSDTRTLLFLRTSGGAKAVTYNLAWLGNDGTFSGPSSLSLPLNQVVSVPVTVRPAAAGAHSVILNLDNPDSPGVEYQTLNTIVAAEQFTAAGNFTVAVPGTADRPDKSSFFFNVPPGTPAFKAEITNVTGRVRLARFHPYGLPLDSTAGFQTGGTQSRTTENPAAGVWEIAVDTSRASPVSPTTFTVVGSILGAAVLPASVTIDPTVLGATNLVDLVFSNRLAEFTGGAAGGNLGSASAARPAIANLQQQQTVIAVPPGSTQLRVRIGNPSDFAADLDLYVFNEAGQLVAYSADGDSEEEVSIPAPRGTYLAVVDAYAVPAGSTEYDYLDVVANPAFGAIRVSDPAALHPSGDVWTRTAEAVALADPGAGRFLQGFVRIFSGTSPIGAAEIILKNVQP